MPSSAVRWLAVLLLAAAPETGSCAEGTFVRSIQGSVQLSRVGQPWKAATNDSGLAPGDKIKTGPRSSCEIFFSQDSRVKLGANSDFALKREAPEADVDLQLGTLRATLKSFSERPLRVRTPTAVAAVRGTDFRVTVDEGGVTLVDLYEGLLGVADDSGGDERLLRPGERIRVDETGLGSVERLSGALQREQQGRQDDLRREVGLGLSKEQVLEAAAEEIKLAEYQQGKAIIDVSGDRVRLEQYIVRPQPDAYKLVVLNERSSRFDYFYYQGTFNKDLPTDLSVALKELGGRAGSAPEWYLTGYETGRSNTVDEVQETASGGHPVDVNNNPDPNDDVSQYFDAAADEYVGVAAGTPFYSTLFDNYAIAYNGLTTFSWAGTNIQSLAAVAKTYHGGFGNYVLETDFPDSPVLHQRIRESFGDGSVFVQYDNYLVSDDGSPAAFSDFDGITSGPVYKQTLLKWNFQQVVTSSLFEGRKIDLVVEPKTLIQSGLIP